MIGEVTDTGQAGHGAHPPWTAARSETTVVTLRKRIRWPQNAPLRQLRAAS